jgi:hypothetical protein
MANVLLNWTAPADTSNITGIVILKKSVSAGSSVPSCGDFIPDEKIRGANTAADLTDSTVSQVGSDITDPATVAANGSVTETGVTAGSYYYAAFSYNAAGYSPCDVTNSELVIS